MKQFRTNCIMCPLGCELMVKVDGNNIKVSGNNCPRGEVYVKNELSEPVRNISTLVKVGGRVVPVKSSAPIPKNKIFECLNEISGKILSKPPKFGEIVIKNILNLGVDIVAIGF